MASEELVTEQFQFFGIDVPNEVINKCVSLCDEYNIDAESFIEQWMAFSLNHLNGSSPNLDNLDTFVRKEFSKRAANRSNATSKENGQVGTGSSLTVYGAPASVQYPFKAHAPLSFLSVDTDQTMKFYPIIWLQHRSKCNALYLKYFNAFQRVKVEIESVSNQTNDLCPASYSPSVGSNKYATRTNVGAVVHSYGDEKLLQNISEPCGHDVLNLKITQVPNDDGDTYNKAMFGFELLHEKASMFDGNIRYVSQCIMKKSGIKELTSVRCKTQAEVAVAGRIECDADARLNPKSVVLQGTWEQSLSQTVPVDLDNVKQYSLFPGQTVVMKGVNTRGDKFVAHEVFCDASPAVTDHKADLTNTLQGKMSMVIASGPYTTSDNMTYEPLKDLVTYISTHQPHVVIMTGPFLDSDHTKVKDNTMAETFKSFFDKLIDSLGELSNTRGMGGDKLSRLAGHILMQQTYYPLWPPAQSLSVDAALWAAHAQLSCIPHVLVLPSNFRYFVKEVNGCVVVNPEHLTKGTGGGTFARLLIQNLKDDKKIAAQIVRI
ncbi:hypothetical protein HF086_003480 [Spodoptera exigua]|uniref:DNA polymerase alpha subunit B n=1 Tax=Spodoptera exigua TaxID=7107 RepID=A0A922SFP8_SPOEX|nr:hypothetical protein HF086_003480 [Spodoptera exigua]